MEHDPSTPHRPEVAPQSDSLLDQVALGGLSRWAATRFAKRLDERAEELRETVPTPSRVDANSLQHTLLAGTPEEERDEEEEQLVRLRYQSLRSGSPKIKKTDKETDKEVEKEYPYTSLRPTSRSERRAARRADRKLRRNMRPAVVNRTYELTYNETIGGETVKIGTPKHEDMLASERLSGSERREAKKATRQYKKNRLAIDNRFDTKAENASKLASRIRSTYLPAEPTSERAPATTPDTDSTDSTGTSVESKKPAFSKSLFEVNEATQQTIQGPLQEKLAELAEEKRAKKAGGRKERDNPVGPIKLTREQRELLKIDQMEALNEVIKPEIDKLQEMPASTPKERSEKNKAISTQRFRLIQEFMVQKGIDASDPTAVAEIAKRYLVLAEAHDWFSKKTGKSRHQPQTVAKTNPKIPGEASKLSELIEVVEARQVEADHPSATPELKVTVETRAERAERIARERQQQSKQVNDPKAAKKEFERRQNPPNYMG